MPDRNPTHPNSSLKLRFAKLKNLYLLSFSASGIPSKEKERYTIAFHLNQGMVWLLCFISSLAGMEGGGEGGLGLEGTF